MTIKKKTWKKIIAGAAIIASLSGAAAALITKNASDQKTTGNIVLRPTGARTNAEFGKDKR